MVKHKKITLVISTMRSSGGERVMSKFANYFVSKEHSATLITFVASSEKPFHTLDGHIMQLPLNCLSFYNNIVVYGFNVLKCLYVLRKVLKKSHLMMMRSPKIYRLMLKNY